MSDAFEQLFVENDRIAPTDEKQYANVGALACEDGSTLPEVTDAYQTWGSSRATTRSSSATRSREMLTLPSGGTR